MINSVSTSNFQEWSFIPELCDQYHRNLQPNGAFTFHNGATGGYNSDLFIHPQTKSVLVVLYNTRYNGRDRQSFTTALHKVMLQ